MRASLRDALEDESVAKGGLWVPYGSALVFKLCTVVPEARCLHVLMAWSLR